MGKRSQSCPGVPVLASPTSRPRFSAGEPHLCPLWSRRRSIPPISCPNSRSLQCVGGPRVKRGGSPRRGAAAGRECLVRIPDFLPKCLDFLQPAPAAAEQDRASSSCRRPPPPRHMVARPFLRRAWLPRLARPRRAGYGIMPSGPPGPGEWQGGGAAGRVRRGAAQPPASLRAPGGSVLPKNTSPGSGGVRGARPALQGLARRPGGSAAAAPERAFPCSAEATRVGG